MPQGKKQGQTTFFMEESPHKGRTGLRRAWNATRYSLAGLAAAARHEAAFRELVLLLLVGVPLALWLTQDGVERALLVGSLLLVLIVELLNAGIEATVDRVSLASHPLAKRAKDIGSAAVMLALLNAAVVWLLILL
jgi:diacylglycerol kinase (ATP)